MAESKEHSVEPLPVVAAEQPKRAQTILGRLTRAVREQNWFAVTLEFAIVVLGVVIGFQVNAWGQERSELAKEKDYIARLIGDVQSDIPVIEQAIELAQLRKEMADVLMEVAVEPAVASRDPIRFVAAVHQAAFTYSPNLTAHTFEDLRSTGNLRLIRDLDIKEALFRYYDYDQDQKQYRPLQFRTESRHFELAAGVLTFDQARLVQDTWYVVNPGDLESFDTSRLAMDEVLAAAQRLAAREELVAWLPEIRHLQIEQVLVNEDLLAQADSVLTLLQQYAARLG